MLKDSLKTRYILNDTATYMFFKSGCIVRRSVCRGQAEALRRPVRERTLRGRQSEFGEVQVADLRVCLEVTSARRTNMVHIAAVATTGW